MSVKEDTQRSYVLEKAEATARSERVEARTAVIRPSARPTIYEPLLNDAEAAQFLGGLHAKTVQRMARRGELPHYRIGKYYRYRASELSEWLMLHSSGQNNPSALNPKEIQ